MKESELYKELGVLTKDKSRWKENIPKDEIKKMKKRGQQIAAPFAYSDR